VRPPPFRIRPGGRAALEEAARVLAGRREDGAESAPGLLAVTFGLGGGRCAVEAAAVQRAVLRLGGVAPISRAGGGERLVAFVDERPVPVVDLLRPGSRTPEDLSDAPALLLTLESGPVAVAVQGPLDLSEEPIAQAAQSVREDPEVPQLAGRLADGTSLIDAGWMRRFAARALAP